MSAGDNAQDAEDAADAAPIPAGNAMEGFKSRWVMKDNLQLGLRRQFLFHMPPQRDEVGDVQGLLVFMQILASCSGLNHVELE